MSFLFPPVPDPPLGPSGDSLPDEFSLSAADPDWPPLWREMNDPPRKIHVRGFAAPLQSPLIAIVGTRRASVRGRAMARALASAFSIRGWTIVSGMARGIDAAAHQGALDVGGATVAVMGTGLDLTYPPGHVQIRREIENQGCTITEFDHGAPPRKYHFPLRNRLIAGMAQAVVVVEAPLKSGALGTAYLALDYNREVFAVPGPVDLETSRGCHHLLRLGANLLESVEDLHQVLPPPSGKTKAKARQPGGGPQLPLAGSTARWIFDRLDFEGVSREKLRDLWAGNQEGWSEGMTALELAGLIRRLPGGKLARSIWGSAR